MFVETLKDKIMKVEVNYKPNLINDTNSIIGLFELAILYRAIDKPKNEVHKQALYSQIENNFNVWLVESKGLTYGDEAQYKKYLIQEMFIEFLRVQFKQQTERLIKHNKERKKNSVMKNPKTK